MSLADHLRQQVNAHWQSIQPRVVETPHVQHYGSGVSNAPGYSAQHQPLTAPAGYGVPAQGTPEYMAGYHAGWQAAASFAGKLFHPNFPPNASVIWQAGFWDGAQAYQRAHAAPLMHPR